MTRRATPVQVIYPIKAFSVFVEGFALAFCWFAFGWEAALLLFAVLGAIFLRMQWPRQQLDE